MTNREIAERLVRLAHLIELGGGDPFRARAYRRAARVIEAHRDQLSDRTDPTSGFEDVPGVGPAISRKISELLDSGSLRKVEELERSIPHGLRQVAHLKGVGPRRAREMQLHLGIDSLDDLARALGEDRVRTLPGFGPRVERHIAEGLARYRDVTGFMNLSDARRVVLPLVERIRRRPQALRAEAAGDLRRCSDVVRIPAVVVACPAERSHEVFDAIAADDAVAEVLARAPGRMSVRIDADVRLEVVTSAPDAFGAALLAATGSIAHVARLTSRAAERGFELRSDGVFAGDERIAAATEHEIYGALELPFIEPELREDAGEIEAADGGFLPRLLEITDVRGDLHSHTTASDGRASIEDMARAARERGYEYLAITDHTKSTKIANGLDERRLLAHLDAIERANARVPGIRLLKSAEVDILRDGSLDLPDEVLARLDLRVCSLHALLRLPVEEQTERVLTAMRNRHFNVLGHPTGRVIGHRDPSPLDLERILGAAREHGCFVELNAQATRLDLAPDHCRMAKRLGVMIVVSTDSHSTEGLAQMEVGVAQARRAWLEASDVANTRSWEDLRTLLARN